MTSPRHPLRLNVGFILHQEVGTSNDFTFDLPEAQLADDLELQNLLGTLAIGRTAQGLLFTGDFSAHTQLTCVRCLKSLDQRLAWSMTELYATSEKSVSESGLIVPEDAQIDLRPLLREYALLEIPINPVCKPDCKGLCPICGEDLNLRDCGHRPSSGTTPLGALRDFLEK